MAEQKKDAIFADGMIYKLPNENAPEWVKGSISIKVDDFKAFLDKHVNNGWINLDFKKSQKGTMYFQLNDWKPEVKTEVPTEEVTESVPF